MAKDVESAASQNNQVIEYISMIGLMFLPLFLGLVINSLSYFDIELCYDCQQTHTTNNNKDVSILYTLLVILMSLIFIVQAYIIRSLSTTGMDNIKQKQKSLQILYQINECSDDYTVMPTESIEAQLRKGVSLENDVIVFATIIIYMALIPIPFAMYLGCGKLCRKRQVPNQNYIELQG